MRADTRSRSDWLRLRVYDTQTKKTIERSVGGAKFTFGATWVGDKVGNHAVQYSVLSNRIQGFIYKRVIDYDTTDDNYQAKEGQFGLFYHQIGTPQSEDVLIWKAPEGVFQYIGKPLIITSDARERNKRRAWLMLDIYINTSPATEVLMVELPGRTAGPVGTALPTLVLNEKRWVSKGFTGMTNCKFRSISL